MGKRPLGLSSADYLASPAQREHAAAWVHAYSAALGDPLASPLAEGESCAPECSCGTFIQPVHEVVSKYGFVSCEGCGENCKGIREHHSITCRSSPGFCGSWGGRREIVCQPRWWIVINCCGQEGCNCPPGDCHDPGGSGSGDPVYGYMLIMPCQLVNACPES